MPSDPEAYLGEVLGRPAEKGFDPSAHDFTCPFTDSKCIKRSAALSEPYPVCSIRRRDMQICVCPKRFYEVDFLRDVVEHCWPGDPPENARIAREVKMTGFGNVDFVIADVGKRGEIGQFLSVELQAIDITGTVMDAYQALRAGKTMESKKSYGLNWGNVYKRYITQLIRKGYFHHHWGTKIVAVMQDVVYQYVREWADFMRSPDVKGNTVNIIFMSYRYEEDPENPGAKRFLLNEVEGTSHANLQQAVLYKEAPVRDQFCAQIQKALSRSSSPDDLSGELADLFP